MPNKCILYILIIESVSVFQTENTYLALRVSPAVTKCGLYIIVLLNAQTHINTHDCVIHLMCKRNTKHQNTDIDHIISI